MEEHLLPSFRSVVFSLFLPWSSTLLTAQANGKFHPSLSLARVNTTVLFLLQLDGLRVVGDVQVTYNRYFLVINAYMNTVATRCPPLSRRFSINLEKKLDENF